MARPCTGKRRPPTQTRDVKGVAIESSEGAVHGQVLSAIAVTRLSDARRDDGSGSPRAHVVLALQ